MLDYKAKEKVEIGLVKLIYKWINSNQTIYVYTRIEERKCGETDRCILKELGSF